MNRGNGKQPLEMAATSGHEHSTVFFFFLNFIFLFMYKKQYIIVAKEKYPTIGSRKSKK